MNSMLTVSLVFASFITHAKLQFTEPFTFNNNLNHKVAIAQDAHGVQFIAKSHAFAEQAIAEVLSARIGIAIGLNINEVEFIALEIYSPITTLHSIVPGQEVYRQDIDGGVVVRGGLMTHENFRSLAAFIKLCPIIALDIFTDNYDRHNGNLFFDALSQQFYAIDMDYAFCKITGAPIDFIPATGRDSMSFNTYTFLKEYQGNKKELSTKEKDALHEIKRALEKMLAAYSPKKLYDEWMELACEIKRNYTRAEKIKIAKVLTKQYYMTKLLHAQLTILTNNTTREYTAEAILFAGETMMQLQSKYQELHKASLEKFDRFKEEMRGMLQAKFN